MLYRGAAIPRRRVVIAGDTRQLPPRLTPATSSNSNLLFLLHLLLLFFFFFFSSASSFSSSLARSTSAFAPGSSKARGPPRASHLICVSADSACLPACLLACLLPCLLACLLACPPACLTAALPASLLLPVLHTRSHLTGTTASSAPAAARDAPPRLFSCRDINLVTDRQECREFLEFKGTSHWEDR